MKIKKQDKIFMFILACISIGGLTGYFVGLQLLDFNYQVALVVSLSIATAFVMVPLFYFRDELKTKPCKDRGISSW